MPINIINFSQNKRDDEFKLISYDNEYFLKIGYSRPTFNLLNMYVIKNENSKTLDLESGQIKIITFPLNENEIILQINNMDKKITEESYINLKILSKEITDNLYIPLLFNISFI